MGVKVTTLHLLYWILVLFTDTEKTLNIINLVHFRYLLYYGVSGKD